MTEPPSGRPDDPQPPAADTDHERSDFASEGYDDRQASGDESLGESLAYETRGAHGAARTPETVGPDDDSPPDETVGPDERPSR